MHIPPEVLNLLKAVPEKDIATVCKHLKITASSDYKNYTKINAATKTPCTDYLISIFRISATATDRVAGLYHSIEGLLFAGGCIPGVGIAFNIIDACFCVVLGNWLGAAVAILSCFPIPGFKLAGKAVEKVIAKIFSRLSPNLIAKLVNLLTKQITKLGLNIDKCMAKIIDALKKYLIAQNKPFADEIIKLLEKVVKQITEDLQKAATVTQKTINVSAQNSLDIGKTDGLHFGSLTSMTQKKVIQKTVTQKGINRPIVNSQREIEKYSKFGGSTFGGNPLNY